MYKPVVAIIRGFLKVAYGIKAIGLENIPESGGAIVAANHVSFVDPLAVVSVVRRPIHFMAKAELFKYPVIRHLFYSVHAFPVKRGMADRAAIRTGIDIITNGNLLGIFPEGTRSKSSDLLPIQGGAALLSFKTGAPVIPVVVKGVTKLRFRQEITVIIGTPLQFGGPQRASKEDIAEASSRISEQFTYLLGRNIG